MCHVIHLHSYITSRLCPPPLTFGIWNFVLLIVWDSELQRNGNSNLEYIYFLETVTCRNIYLI